MPDAEQAAPLTLEQAIGKAERFALIDAQIEKHEAQRTARLAKVNAASDAAVAPLIQERAAIVAELKPWWDGARETLSTASRKSFELGGCLTGYRTTRAAVAYAGGDDDAAIAVLGRLKWGRDLIRTKLSLDRTAIGAALRQSNAGRLTKLGFSLKQHEIFFLERKPGAPIGRTQRAPAIAA